MTFLSARHWSSHIWSPAISAGLPCTRKILIHSGKSVQDQKMIQDLEHPLYGERLRELGVVS